MRCERHDCQLKKNCKNYLRNTKYKLIIENPNTTLCEQFINKTSKSA